MKLLTVITVTYNASSVLEKTIRSVIGQSVFDQIEYILVDGGSKDDTIQIAHRHKSSFDHIISEPDHGIYDAMNKGILIASAPWICFMNAGDTFYDHDTVSSLHLEQETPDHILYGDCVRVWPNGRRESRKARPFFTQSKLITGIGICHQATYMPTQILVHHPFLWKEYPHCADFKLCYDLWKEGLTFKRIDAPLCLYAYGEGFSSDTRYAQEVLHENARIIGKEHSLQYYKQKIKLWLSSLK